MNENWIFFIRNKASSSQIFKLLLVFVSLIRYKEEKTEKIQWVWEQRTDGQINESEGKIFSVYYYWELI